MNEKNLEKIRSSTEHTILIPKVLLGLVQHGFSLGASFSKHLIGDSPCARYREVTVRCILPLFRIDANLHRVIANVDNENVTDYDKDIHEPSVSVCPLFISIVAKPRTDSPSTENAFENLSGLYCWLTKHIE